MTGTYMPRARIRAILYRMGTELLCNWRPDISPRIHQVDKRFVGVVITDSACRINEYGHLVVIDEFLELRVLSLAIVLALHGMLVSCSFRGGKGVGIRAEKKNYAGTGSKNTPTSIKERRIPRAEAP
eukprot:368917-Pelagomonas_calceolata.AAC.2